LGFHDGHGKIRYYGNIRPGPSFPGGGRRELGLIEFVLVIAQRIPSAGARRAMRRSTSVPSMVTTLTRGTRVEVAGKSGTERAGKSQARFYHHGLGAALHPVPMVSNRA
jgi:hypothetical protein